MKKNKLQRWYLLNVGEVVQKGDQLFDSDHKYDWETIDPSVIGLVVQRRWLPIRRRAVFIAYKSEADAEKTSNTQKSSIRELPKRRRGK